MLDWTPKMEEAFWGRVDKPTADNSCWLWTGSMTRHGYGRFFFKGPRGAAHRCAYELLAGEIPAGLELDHLCRNPACVNPDHLEPVTHAENVLRGNGPTAENARKEVCDRGHDLVGLNVYRDPRGRRQCRACRSEAAVRFKESNPGYQKGKRYPRKKFYAGDCAYCGGGIYVEKRRVTEAKFCSKACAGKSRKAANG